MYIHIICGLKDKRVLLLGTDITNPESRHGWVRREAKAEKANGLFHSVDTEGNNIYVTHTFPKESLALAVTKTSMHLPRRCDVLGTQSLPCGGHLQRHYVFSWVCV
jgi:hypothetical protein